YELRSDKSECSSTRPRPSPTISTSSRGLLIACPVPNPLGLGNRRRCILQRRARVTAAGSRRGTARSPRRTRLGPGCAGSGRAPGVRAGSRRAGGRRARARARAASLGPRRRPRSGSGCGCVPAHPRDRARRARGASPPTGAALADYADAVAGVFDDLALPPETDVLGNGLGGFVALALAARHGARFARMVLVGS